jgi:hypothetical protein
MIKQIRSSALFLMLTLIAGNSFSQDIPKIIEKDGRHALLVDGKPFFMISGQAHNSSGWPGMLTQLWTSVEELHLNTVEIPLYWEQIEAQPGKFDFSLIDTLLAQSRAHRVHLVLLWFGTWKNGSNHYMPEWMKRDAAKYPNTTGKNGQPFDSPSPNTKATLDADIKAFSAVMGHIKQADPQHTILMVQVENESGSWATVRDYSPMAQKLFEGQVPAELLKPELLKQLNVPVVTGGTWAKVFGDRGDEYFQAWSVASFIGKVAAAGKAEYSLPLYTNAALRDPLTNPMANNYESGGPTDNVIPIWKIAAPALDLVAPDIYLSGSERVLKVLDLYARPDNALFVPEAGLKAENAKYFYEVIARGGIGFSPFGIDDNGEGATKKELTERLAPFAQEYEAAAPMMNELAQWGFDGKVKSVVEHDDHTQQTMELGNWEISVSFGGDGRANAAPVYGLPTGKLLVATLDENTFIMMGSRCHIKFIPAGNNTGKAWEYLKVEEGHYENGQFKMLRILNGDETDWGGPGFGEKPTVLRVSVVVR